MYIFVLKQLFWEHTYFILCVLVQLRNGVEIILMKLWPIKAFKVSPKIALRSEITAAVTFKPEVTGN